MNKIISTTLSVSLLSLLTLWSCKDEESTSQLDDTKSAAVKQYSAIVYANYTDVYDAGLALQTSIETFLANPSQNTLDAAKQAWLDARESYGQSEAFRFYGGPIDGEDGPEGQINAWPLDESYIDYVVGDEGDGTNIINSPDQFPEITADVLAGLNEQGSETNISTGYHAIEFLLWGQDLSAGPGGGNRPYTDYLTDGTGTNDNQDRRAKYLSEVTKLLVSDLKYLVDSWEEGSTYRTSFESNVDLSLENIISGLGKLSKGELAGERMFVAYDTRGKEDEQSCFSDNTDRDIVNDALGIQNVYLGSYQTTSGSTISGTSIYAVLVLQDKDLADQLKTQIATSVELAEKIQAPFDQEFLDADGRVRIYDTITSLRTQGDQLAQAAQELGFSFDPSDV